MTKRFLALTVAALCGFNTLQAQQTDYFTPYQQIDLRLPAVPLVVNDPYFSIWSPYNELNGGTTRIWYDQEKSMDGLLRVDGEVYRFMGQEKGELLGSLLPMGNKGAWTAKVKYADPGAGWANPDVDETRWQTQRGPFGSKGEYPYIQTSWTGDNKDIYIRRHVTLTEDDLKSDLYLIYSHDDKCEAYINGTQVVSTDVSWKQNVRKHLTGAAKEALHVGDNVIGYHVHNTNGGSQADIGLYINKRGPRKGYEPLAPMADAGAWTARVKYTSPGTGWTTLTYDDSKWSEQEGAFGTQGEYPNVHTSWTNTNSDIYIRRHFTLSAADLEKALVLIYSHDDVCDASINGRRIVSTGNTWVQNVEYRLTAEDKAVLTEGDNVIAYHVHNTMGGALADIGLYADPSGEIKAKQKSIDVLPTQTYYTLECGPVELDLVFTAPFLMDDLDLMSVPINYISYQVRSTDGKEHDVQFYFGTTPELTVDDNSQATVSTIVKSGETTYIKSGSVEQKVLGRAGDNISIDWGYLYIPDINGKVSISDRQTMRDTFVRTGDLPETQDNVKSAEEYEMPMLAYVHDFGKVTNASSYMMVGYDEVKDIRYMDVDYKGYWARNGKTITEAFEEMKNAYDQTMQRCQQQDKVIYDDGLAAGNKKYAELLCASYRQCIAAHKLFQDKKGNLLFFSKENNSNGCVNTVDLTYPSAPLFLIYNTDLLKGMCTSILDYCQSTRWGFDFAAHDLGTYPIANNQVYSIRFPEGNGGFAGNMPIEESGNIVILAAAISLIDGNLDWANRYWKTLTTWTEYLAENGLDPENQLCTDDFAGHLAHNANLSIKAIMGVAGYALMCKMKGETDNYQAYMTKAQEMATEWVRLAKDGNHYKLAFDRAGTWSQKYNMVWDKLWSLNLFPEAVKVAEYNFYTTKQNNYGLPLDSRESYTKSDWVAWTATLARSNTYFLRLMDPLYKYVNETSTRVPLSDWYSTTTGQWIGFRARSVIGGHWMKVLYDKIQDGTLMSGIQPIVPLKPQDTPYSGWYDLSGRSIEQPQQSGIYIHQGKKVLKR